MPSSHLIGFHRAYAQRTTRRGEADRAYLVYAGVLVAALVAFPVVRAIVIALRADDVVAFLTSKDGAHFVGLVVAALALGAFLAGRRRGPIVMPAYLAWLLMDSDIPRRRALARSVLRALIETSLAALFLASLVVGAIARPAELAVSSLAVLGVGALAAGVLIGTLWLVGQAAHGWMAWALPLMAVATGLIVALVPAVPATVVLVAVSAIALACTPAMLDQLTSAEVIRQSLRWEIVTVSSATGDVQGALAHFREPPVRGRTRNLVSARSFTGGVIASDLASVVRTPSRAVVGAVALAAGGYLFGLALSASAAWSWGIAAVATVTTYGGLGVLTDGVRHAVESLRSTRIYGISDRRLVASHAVGPVIAGSGLFGCGAFLAMVAGFVPTHLVLVCVVVVPTLLTVVRLYDATKGQPPQSVSLPVVTPLGDLSAVSQILWQLDAVILAGLVGSAVLAATARGNVVLGCATLVVLPLVLLWRVKRRISATASLS